MTPRRAAVAPALPAALLLALLAGCVTEERPLNPMTRRGAPVRSESGSEPAALPEGPIATPVRGGTISSSVRVEVLPLGSVVYDGQVLPLVSPDGRFLAAQQGEAASWQALLAADGAAPPMRTRVARFDISGKEPQRLGGVEALPPGLLLGRSCDTRGFLVEAPQPDGSRWIGRVEWVSGALAWLVQDNAVNAHATLTVEGDVVFSRHEPGRSESTLVLLGGSGVRSEWGRPGEAWLTPVCGADPGRVYALVSTDEGLSLACVLVERSGGGPRLSGLAWTNHLFDSAQPGVPYQMTAPTPPAVAHDPAEPLLIFHPVMDRMVRVDPQTGSLGPLPARSVAGASSPVAGAPGWFSATPQGLLFTPRDEPSALAGAEVPGVRVLGDAYVPRATTDPARPFILIGPVRREPTRLAIVAMGVP